MLCRSDKLSVCNQQLLQFHGTECNKKTILKGNISLVLVIYTNIEFLLLLWDGFYDYTSTTFEQSSHFISSTKNLNNGSVIIITLLSTKWCLLSMIFYVQRTNFRYFYYVYWLAKLFRQIPNLVEAGYTSQPNFTDVIL